MNEFTLETYLTSWGSAAIRINIGHILWEFTYDAMDGGLAILTHFFTFEGLPRKLDCCGASTTTATAADWSCLLRFVWSIGDVRDDRRSPVPVRTTIIFARRPAKWTHEHDDHNAARNVQSKWSEQRKGREKREQTKTRSRSLRQEFTPLL